MADDQDKKLQEFVKAEIKEWLESSTVAFLGVGLGATIVIMTVIVFALLWYGIVQEDKAVLQEILRLVQ